GRGRCQPAGGRQLGLATVRPLRRCTAVVVVAGLAATVAASGCGSVTPSAAVVKFDHDSVKIDRSDFEKELKALNDNKKLQAAAATAGRWPCGPPCRASSSPATASASTSKPTRPSSAGAAWPTPWARPNRRPPPASPA